jgi:hypothetical protein
MLRFIRKGGQAGLGLLIGLWACASGEAIEANRRTAPAKALRPLELPGAAARIDFLINQLGSEQYAEREAAGRELAKYGAQALPALRQAARSSDAEVRRRVKELLQAIRTKAEPPVRGPDGKPLPLYWDGVGR